MALTTRRCDDVDLHDMALTTRRRIIRSAFSILTVDARQSYNVGALCYESPCMIYGRNLEQWQRCSVEMKRASAHTFIVVHFFSLGRIHIVTSSHLSSCPDTLMLLTISLDCLLCWLFVGWRRLGAETFYMSHVTVLCKADNYFWHESDPLEIELIVSRYNKNPASPARISLKRRSVFVYGIAWLLFQYVRWLHMD